MMKSKLSYALLALVISFGLWLYVITTVSPESEETYWDVPVVLEGESVLMEHNLMVTDKDDIGVDIRVSGNRSDLIRANKENITVRVDVSRIREPGENIELHFAPVQFPGDIPPNALVVESIYPERIHITVEERRVKEVPVEVKWVGSTPDGFISDRENKILDYPVITVVGPASSADLIEKAVIEVDLDDQKESISESYRYTLCDAEGNPVDAKRITTNVEQVRLDVKILRVKDLDISYNLVEGGGANGTNTVIKTNVDTIRVSGSEAALDALGDQLIIGTINLKDLPKSTTLTYPINLPEGVNNLTGVTDVQVEVEFVGLSVREFVIENIKSVNVPEGMEADIITEKITVAIRGPLTAMSAVEEDDISLVVDFTGAEAGTSTYKAGVVFKEGFEHLGAIGTVSVSATLQKK